ncbi:hypothetical protein PtA15_10A275 [Puccinia triticina]|uniref:PEP5/VPS11 N-terminal domain-containing protein n=1 Tax=Puccinia triticina TaxID=208348 RepID=A0ABY7CW39_9BASI|nr:uncharacterized protein PtA15_10A275 [Puccinia triticina]WAQ88854.1 hypothetical protein PtA15_10A275 [Puccinia triticina]
MRSSGWLECFGGVACPSDHPATPRTTIHRHGHQEGYQTKPNSMAAVHLLPLLPAPLLIRLGNPPELLSQPHSIAAIEAGFNSTILAHLDGRISLLDPSIDLLRSWPAFPGGRTLLVIPTSIKDVLISIGEEASNSVPILKIWNLRHGDNQSSAPQLLGFSKIQNGNCPHPVTTWHPLSTCLILPLAWPMVPRPPPVLPKPKIIYTSPEPITGLAFRSPKPSASQPYFSNPDLPEPALKPSSTHRHACLFIVTTAKVLCFFFTLGHGAGSGAELIVMDDLGGSIGRSEMMDNGDLFLADDSALYVYGPEGRGACLAYEGPKARLNSRGHYLVITSPQAQPASKTMSNRPESSSLISKIVSSLIMLCSVVLSYIYRPSGGSFMYSLQLLRLLD